MSAATNARPPRFPENEILSLLDVRRRHNLAESTSRDLTLGEICTPEEWAELADLELGYGSSQGDPELRGVIAESLATDPARVLVTQGAALGLYLVSIELLRGPEDEAVMIRPSFPPTLDAVRSTGATVREVRCRFEEGYRLDVGEVAAALCERTRLVSLATPQNPSGVAIGDETIAELLALLSERAPAAFLLIDETYREATYDGAVPPSRASLDPRVLTTASISKAHGGPGLRIGWLTTHDDELMRRLIRAKMNTVINASVVDEKLATKLLRRRGSILAERAAVLGAGVRALDAWHAGVADLVDWVRPDGGALCCFRLRPESFDDASVDAFYDRLPAHDLQLADGRWFGDERRVFRLGFGYLPPQRLGAALDAVTAALRG